MTCKSNTNISNYQIMEQKLASFQINNNGIKARYQLLEISKEIPQFVHDDKYNEIPVGTWIKKTYEIRINRNVYKKFDNQYKARKAFANELVLELIQLTIC